MRLAAVEYRGPLSTSQQHAVSKHQPMQNPPVAEVVCGFVFATARVGVLDFGVYADQSVGAFPKTELHPPVFDASPGPQVQVQILPFEPRVWLVSEARDRLVQLQSDRLYFNWRRSPGRTYPHFTSRGDVPGVKECALGELNRFRSFVHTRTGDAQLLLRTLSLAKINALEVGEQFADFDHLMKAVPLISGLAPREESLPSEFLMRWVDGAGGERTTTLIRGNSSGLRIEITHTVDVSASCDLDSVLDRANDAVNDVFFRVVNRDQLGG